MENTNMDTLDATLKTIVTPAATVEQESSKTSMSTYIIVGALVVLLIGLLYYAYIQFVSNSTTSETMMKGLEQERDDPVIDFNLREAIRDLQNMQKNVLSTLSEVSDI